MTKLTEQLKKSIIASKAEKTTKGLADQFKVSQSTIRRVLRESVEAEQAEGQSNQIVMEQAEPKVKGKKTIELKDKIPTISLGQFNLDEPSPKGVKFDTGIEQVITDDADQLEDFAEEWNDGEEEVEEEDEESVEDIRPTKADEKKMAELKQMEEEFVNQAKNPNPVELKEMAQIYEDEASIRSKYLSRIYLNVINFSHLLPFIQNKDKFLQGLHKKTTKELISLSGLIETQRSLGNVATQMKNVFFIVAKGAEMGCSRVGMKVDGFTEDLKQKERELESIFQEIAVEQADNLKSYTTPQMRLAMIFTSSLMLCDSRNRMMANRPQHRPDNHPVAEDLKTKFGDL
jgi:hypothetical protein